MLKRSAVLAATLAALAISVLAGQEAWAANSVHPSHDSSAQPTATPIPGSAASGVSHGDMPGMDHDQLAGMDHVETAQTAGLLAPAVKPIPTPTPAPPMSASTEGDMAGMNHEDTPEGEHDETSGMTDEDMPGMNHGETPSSHENASSGSPATPAAEEGEESHDAHGVETVSEPRPVASLVGAFAVVNGGVMISAAVLRRRDKRRANSSPKPAHPAK